MRCPMCGSCLLFVRIYEIGSSVTCEECHTDWFQIERERFAVRPGLLTDAPHPG